MSLRAAGQLLSVLQAAELLQVPARTVRTLAAEGVLPAVKIGKPWRFDETLLREWVAQRSRENVKPCPSVAVRGIRISNRAAAGSLSERLDRLAAEEQSEANDKDHRRS